MSEALRKAWAFAKFVRSIKVHGTGSLRAAKTDGSVQGITCDAQYSVDRSTFRVTYFDAYKVGVRSFYIYNIIT